MISCTKRVSGFRVNTEMLWGYLESVNQFFFSAWVGGKVCPDEPLPM